MASLELDPASGRYRARFRYDGQAYKRSLHTKQRRVAMATLGQVEETLRLLALGMTELPPKVEAGDFIISGARSRREKLPHSPVRTLSDLFRIYQEELPAGAKEERTLEGERLHFKHLLRHLKPTTKTATLTNHFKSTLAASPWENVRGFHVLRHSFASHAAAEGIDQRMIDEWMGHQTEEMRRRYRNENQSR